MKFNSTNHVYKCTPPVLGNEQEENPVVISLRGVSALDHEAEKAAQRELFLDLSQSKAAEAVDERTEAFIKSRIVQIENLFVSDGETEREIKTYDDLRDYAPQEFYYWVKMAIYSTQILSAAERKN